jgi:hypothetical protein
MAVISIVPNSRISLSDRHCVGLTIKLLQLELMWRNKMVLCIVLVWEFYTKGNKNGWKYFQGFVCGCTLSQFKNNCTTLWVKQNIGKSIADTDVTYHSCRYCSSPLCNQIWKEQIAPNSLTYYNVIYPDFTWDKCFIATEL